MADFYELDFLDVESEKSGDAITIRYEIQGRQFVHVIDAGFQQSGPSVARHIRQHYPGTAFIDHVVVTHGDNDHSGGIRTILEEFEVGALWMLRPWIYADILLPRFNTYTSADRLRSRLKGIYSGLVALEEIAVRRGIPILAPFQGAQIGAFRVLAPSPTRYVDLIVSSDRTPETVDDAQTTLLDRIWWGAREGARRVANLVSAAWGHELFSANATSAENEMSVVQFAQLSGHKIVLTGDAGREALAEAGQYAPIAGLMLPGVDRFQVPHHGSRRNVSTEILDQWLGPRLNQPAPNPLFTALISSAAADPHHPRNSVRRAMIHRGGQVLETEGTSFYVFGGAAVMRPEWSAKIPATYPLTQET